MSRLICVVVLLRFFVCHIYYLLSINLECIVISYATICLLGWFVNLLSLSRKLKSNFVVSSLTLVGLTLVQYRSVVRVDVWPRFWLMTWIDNSDSIAYIAQECLAEWKPCVLMPMSWGSPYAIILVLGRTIFLYYYLDVCYAIRFLTNLLMI